MSNNRHQSSPVQAAVANTNRCNWQDLIFIRGDNVHSFAQLDAIQLRVARIHLFSIYLFLFLFFLVCCACSKIQVWVVHTHCHCFRSVCFLFPLFLVEYERTLRTHECIDWHIHSVVPINLHKAYSRRSVMQSVNNNQPKNQTHRFPMPMSKQSRQFYINCCFINGLGMWQ